MRSTIGEIVDIISPYCISVDVSMYHDHPFIRARVRHRENFTALFMYVLQTSEHVYSVAAAHDDVNGNRFFPYLHDTNGRNFITEQDLVRVLFGINSKDDTSHKYSNVKSGLIPQDFLSLFLTILHANQLIQFNYKEHCETKITEMGINSERIRAAIDEEFKLKGHEFPTIQALLNVILLYHDEVNLTKLRERELTVPIAKLRDIGILCEKKGGKIIGIKFDKAKGF